MDTMLAHYKYLGILDTGSYDVNGVLPEMVAMAEKLGLEHRIIPASVEYVTELLTGPWDENRYVIVPPRSEIREFPLDI